MIKGYLMVIYSLIRPLSVFQFYYLFQLLSYLTSYPSEDDSKTSKKTGTNLVNFGNLSEFKCSKMLSAA